MHIIFLASFFNSLRNLPFDGGLDSKPPMSEKRNSAQMSTGLYVVSLITWSPYGRNRRSTHNQQP